MVLGSQKTTTHLTKEGGRMDTASLDIRPAACDLHHNKMQLGFAPGADGLVAAAPLKDRCPYLAPH